MDKMYCNNCGGKGHLFRTCKDPVLSCGIFLFDQPNLPIVPEQARVLMVRRKDSMSFAEFMRGRYDPTDLDYLGRLFRNMTVKEQSVIACEPFEVIWKQLWGDDRSSEYVTSRERFNSLDRYGLMKTFLSEYTEPEWGFPKGRRMKGETDFECAIREFGEETNIPREAYVVLQNLRLEETFMGLNNIQYRHVYFLAVLKQPHLVNLQQKFTPMQRREISGIGWKSFDEVYSLIRPHHVERKQMLDTLQELIHTFETNDEIQTGK